MTLEQRVLLAFESAEQFTYKDVANEFQIKQQYAKTILSRLKSKEKLNQQTKGFGKLFKMRSHIQPTNVKAGTPRTI